MADDSRAAPGAQIVTTIPDPTTLTNQMVDRAIGDVRAAMLHETDWLKQYLLDTINERDRKYVQRFEALDKSIADANLSIKEALAAALASTREALEKATTNTQQALTTANENIKGALAAVNDRFANITLSMEAFARKSEITQAIEGNRAAVAERFEFIEKQTIKAAADAKSAADAAFAAASASVNQQNQANTVASQKQEAAFTKQIDQLAASVAQISRTNDDKLNEHKKTSDDKFGDLKDRIVAMEGRSSISDPTTAALQNMASAISILKTSNDQNLGGRQQKADITNWIFSAIAAASALAFLVIDIFKPSH